MEQPTSHLDEEEREQLEDALIEARQVLEMAELNT